VWRFVILAGLLDVVGTVASFVGYGLGSVAVVTTLASLYTAVTILLAYIFLHERLHPFQWLGIAVVLGSIVLVSASG
jgi:drug/metabolite transporter (DMT)-like permease